MALPAYMKWLPGEALKTVGRLEFLAHGTVDGFISGKHKSARKGASVEFAEHRQYFPGDDLRNLDWKLVARRQRLYIKQYVDETNLRATIVLDKSGSMGYAGDKAAGGMSKFDYARHVAALLSYLLINQQDAAGIVTFDNKVETYIPAKTSPSQVRNILETIDALTPGEDTSMAAVLHEIAERIPRRSVVFVISDFYDGASELIKALHHLRFRRNEVIAIQIVDPDEAEFPFQDLKRFENMEGVDTLDIDTQAIKKDYIERFNHHLEEVKRGCGEMKITHELVLTSKPYDKALADILIHYAQMGGGR